MRVIAYYLPQFHTIVENDLWWGKGFTEWTNVKKARPLFKNHHQPKEPGYMGYYDLTDIEVREEQARLAKDAGIEAFCYWHYWFGNGKQLLEKPFKEVVESKKPELKFCLGWANESWWAKVWSETSGKKDKLLIEQTYPGKEDAITHFNSLIPAFFDERYLKVDGKPLFVVYRPYLLPDPKAFITLWNDLAKKNGLPGVYFVGHTLYSSQIDQIKQMGFDAVNVVRIGDCRRSLILALANVVSLTLFKLKRKPFVYTYKTAIKKFIGKENKRMDVFPSILPNWDHTPRSGMNGFVLHDSTPQLFSNHVDEVLKSIQNKPKEKQIVFLKSWNEWGEGNYIEPDKKYGSAYLRELKCIVDKYNKND